jgi:tRNA-splicing endonuclease subunit Sen2
VSGLAIFEVGESAPGQPTLRATSAVNGHASAKAVDAGPGMNGTVDSHAVEASASADSPEIVDKTFSNGTRPNGISGAGSTSSSSEDSVSGGAPQEVNGSISASKRRKSVRFSATVESTTFGHSDPPSPDRGAGKGSTPTTPNGEPVLRPEVLAAVAAVAQPAAEDVSGVTPDASADSSEIENKEHYQLAPEEAFFLVFSLGALKVEDPVTGSAISTEQLLSLLRSYSYFPPRVDVDGLRPDDSFLVNYAVYHHFRSLGWVPRHGIKFGVDWIIYQRGPVFDHSEFGIMVMPSYSDDRWEGHEHEESKRSWSWLMGVNRVLSHVLKSLVLVYVDIPPPAVFDEEMRKGGIAAALKKYTIREVMVRRFSVNRNR